MRFSIVIPVFGTEHLLRRCLDSVAAQADGDFEVIVVDDCSPGSEAVRGVTCSDIVAEYDDRFRCVRHERNLSLFQARQTGLRLAQGDYVLPLDSDDYILSKLLAVLKGAIESVAGPSPRHQPDVLVYQMMYDDGHRITKPSVRYRDERLSGAEARERFFASRIQGAICGKAVRRSIYLKAMDELSVGRDFYLNSSEDLCQTFPVLVNASAVATVSYPGYRYWLNGNSLTTTLRDPMRLGKAAENTRRVFDTLVGFIERNGHDGALRSRLEKFMEPTLEWYLGCIRHEPEANWRACAAELCKYFPPDLVARKAMTLIEGSKTFRLGRMLAAWCSRRAQ